jgi:hypothetical protein
MKSTQDGFALVLCWPEKKCLRVYSWYDHLMKLAGVMKNDVYAVGHSAVVLVNADGDCHYFDFGRYGTPIAFGRVRDDISDPFLTIDVKADVKHSRITNIDAILDNIQQIEETECDGKLMTAALPIDFKSTYTQAKQLQDKGLLPYGPFVLNGTNCSRFVRNLMMNGQLSPVQKFKLKYPYMITPSPVYLVKTIGVDAVAESTGTESATLDLEYA